MNHKPGSVPQSLRLCGFGFCFAKLKWSYPNTGRSPLPSVFKKRYRLFSAVYLRLTGGSPC